jgi:hypothetical protein
MFGWHLPPGVWIMKHVLSPVALLLAGTAAPSPAAEPARPNVVVLADD